MNITLLVLIAFHFICISLPQLPLPNEKENNIKVWCPNEFNNFSIREHEVKRVI